MNSTKFSISIAAAAILTACGGGGGDDSKQSENSNNPGNGNATVATAAVLNGTNYQAVAQEALNSSTYLLKSASMATGAQTNSAQAVLEVGEEQARELLKRFGRSQAVAVGVIHTETEACASGGSITYMDDDHNGNGKVDAGDSATLTANKCNMGNGIIMNGQLNLVANSVSGNMDSPPFSLTANITYNNFEVVVGSSKASGNGTATISFSVQNASNISTKMSTQSLTLAASNANVNTQQTLQGYTASSAINGSIASTSADGILVTSNLNNQSIQIATPTLFKIDNSRSRYPHQGVMIITGANTTSVRITSVDSTTVKLELDADGDGKYEVNQTKPWSQML